MPTDLAYHFGPFTFVPTQRLLTAHGRRVALGARAMDLLEVFVARRGRTVSREELLAAVWPGVVVEEANVTVQVSALRKVLGAECLVTVPGRGYRFVAALRTDAHDDPDQGVPSTEAIAPGRYRLDAHAA